MIKKVLGAISFLLLGISLAFGQAPTIINSPPLSGAAIGSGYSMANGTLFMPTSASLQAIKLPMSYSIDIVPALIGGINQLFVNSQTSSPNVGYLLGYNTSTTPDFFHIQAQNRPGYGGNCDSGSAGAMCWRNAPLGDGKRHNLCTVLTATHGYFYMDGVLRDETVNVGAFTAASTTWSFGLNLQPGATLWDFRHYDHALTADECVQLSNLQQANLTPNSGTLTQGMVVHLPFSNCTITGVLYQCPDSSGNSNNATNDKAPPTVTITAPSSGTHSGSVSITSTCVDPAGLTCAKVCYEVDGSLLSCPTTAPYTFAWNTATVIDGSHTLTAIGFNFVGITGTSSPVAVTLSNGVSASAYQFDSVGGSDSNNCISAPCKTFTKLQTIVLKGGDSVAFLHDDAFALTAGYTLCGPLSGCATQNYFPAAATLTFTTYGGGSGCNPVSGSPSGCATLSAGSTALTPFLGINAPNVTVQNLALIGNTASLNTQCTANGFEFDSNVVGLDISSGITITNNFIKDFSCEIMFNNYNSGSYVGLISNYTISDNFLTNSTRVLAGGTFPVNPSSLDGMRMGPNTQGLIQGNLVTYMGGQLNNNGNGIAVFNYPYSGNGTTTAQFNVVHDFGANDLSATGGPVGIYASDANNVLFQFNESYNGLPSTYPTLGSVIDYDCFDMDEGLTNAVIQYNYAHNCPVQAAFNLITQGLSGGNPAWSNNTIRYNISENNAVGIPQGGATTVTHSYVYNNTVSSSLINAGQTGDVSYCAGFQNTDIVFANNLCIWTGSAVSGLHHLSVISPTSLTSLNNDYWSTTAALPNWRFGPLFAGINYSTLSAFQVASGLDTNSLNVDPHLLGTPSTGGTCYVSGIPSGPQPCPSAYQLTSASTQLIGHGLDLTQAPYNQNVGSVDYFGGTIPNGVGSGFNIGADGAHH